jgi:hypothetical protein
MSTPDFNSVSLFGMILLSSSVCNRRADFHCEIEATPRVRDPLYRSVKIVDQISGLRSDVSAPQGAIYATAYLRLIHKVYRVFLVKDRFARIHSTSELLQPHVPYPDRRSSEDIMRVKVPRYGTQRMTGFQYMEISLRSSHRGRAIVDSRRIHYILTGSG